MHGFENRRRSELVTVNIVRQDLESMSGVRLPTSQEALVDLLSSLKCKDAKILEDGTITVENSDRADLWSPEGIARSLRAYMRGKAGLRNYVAEKGSGVRVSVNPKLEAIRPYIGCSVLKGVRLSDIAVKSVVQLQEKLDQSYGRRRVRSSIGLYNFDLITPPLAYDVSKPGATKFVPLDGSEALNLREILESHPKGIEYGHIVEKNSEWPILLDARKKVLSFPPIINSNDLGRITGDTRNVLIEVTGTSHETVVNALTLMTIALADRGGSIETARVSYPYGSTRNEVTPPLRPLSLRLYREYVNQVVGARLSRPEIMRLLTRSGHRVQGSGRGAIVVQVAPYRLDVMHPIDLVEDVAFAFGLNNLEARWPALNTIGGLSAAQEFEDLIRELMIGLGFQEVLTYTLTVAENLFHKMNMPRQKTVELSNPRIQSMSCLRSWLLPSILEILSANTHVEYPQRIFEVGHCVQLDPSQETGTRDLHKLSFASAHANANFTEARSYLQPLFGNLGLGFRIEETPHPSFIEGRAGKIVCDGRDVGLIGELHPQVLEAWRLANPVSAAEIFVDELFTMRGPKH